MIPEALFVSPQEESARALLPILQRLGTHVERHTDAMTALTRLWTSHYDAVIVDCEGRGDEAEVVREVHEAGRNKNAITIAVIGHHEDPDLAYAMGAHFVLRKPLTRPRVERMMRAAHALMTQERRRHNRYLCEGPVAILQGGAESAAELVDMSQGGVAIQMGKKRTLNGNLRLRFKLPGARATVTAAAEVAWRNSWGRVGVRFTEIGATDRRRLAEWAERQHVDRLVPMH
jgi:CheY-like chemotaxis protein